MNLGWLIALLVLIVVVVAIVFTAAMPAWLPLVLIGLLALAILLSGYSVPMRS